jgi:hypothetical protein
MDKVVLVLKIDVQSPGSNAGLFCDEGHGQPNEADLSYEGKGARQEKVDLLLVFEAHGAKIRYNEYIFIIQRPKYKTLFKIQVLLGPHLIKYNNLQLCKTGE